MYCRVGSEVRGQWSKVRVLVSMLCVLVVVVWC